MVFLLLFGWSRQIQSATSAGEELAMAMDHEAGVGAESLDQRETPGTAAPGSGHRSPWLWIVPVLVVVLVFAAALVMILV